MQEPDDVGRDDQGGPGRLLEADDVARYIGMTTDWIYREVRHQTRARPRESVAVGAAAREHAKDVHELLVVAREAHTPIADPEPPLVLVAGELYEVPDRRVADEAIERLNDSSLHRTIQAAQVATGPGREDPAAARLGA